MEAPIGNTLADPLQGKETTMKLIDVIAAVLLVIGGLNWGLWGLFEVDFVASIFGSNAAVGARFIYILAGRRHLPAANLKGIQARWNVSMADPPPPLNSR